jgi:linoleate 8R-lipoxygenase / 9,12-octadecadienoate 8-hydroperoxide 8R-isomerase
VFVPWKVHIFPSVLPLSLACLHYFPNQLILIWEISSLEMAGIVIPQSEPVKPSEIHHIRRKLDRGFRHITSFVNAAEKTLPTETGDGTYLEHADDSPELVKKIESGLKNLSHLGITDINTLIQVQDKQKAGALWDDKQYLMERLIQTAARFPDDSATGKKVTDGFLAALYNDLHHPPIS